MLTLTLLRHGQCLPGGGARAGRTGEAHQGVRKLEESPMSKKFIAAVAGVVLAAGLASCGGGSSASGGGGAGNDTITMGFAQVGAESGWRTANTKSVQESAKEAGIDLKFSDAQQKQENQIKAIRSYIQQKVDVIAFSPVVESGWDAVLNEAKR